MTVCELRLPVDIGGEVRIAVKRWKGTKRIDFRFFTQTKEDGWQGTKRGVVVPLAKLPAIKHFFDEAYERFMEGEFGEEFNEEAEDV